jgi:outer membrane protein
MNNKSKRNVKIIALAIVAFFALGIVGIAVSQTSVGLAAPSSSAIGVIDMKKALDAHPDVATANAALQKEVETVRSDFEAWSPGKSDEEKQKYGVQLDQRINQKRQELLNAIVEKVKASVKKVANSKGLSVVIASDFVIYGGTDITDDVIKSFGKKD